MAENKNTSRPPIVAVLGHVDAGKTTLIDFIRRTNTASREVGRITQSIGAWQAKTKDGKTITFIDTPGHEAFNKMRLHGAKVADIGILVIAADDGIMPQTKESIKLLQETKTPFIVTITKIDLDHTNTEIVKSQLAQEGVLLEGQGGDTIAVEVSSITGKGIDELLEMISLLAEMHEITGDPKGNLETIVIETERDPRRGPVVSAIVKNGTLKVGQEVETDNTRTRVRGLFGEYRKPIGVALPATPVEILGFDQLPEIGTSITHTSTQKKAAEQAEVQTQPPLRSRSKQEGLSIVLKADTAGSLQALQDKLKEQVIIIYSGIGDIIKSDVMISSTTNSPIIGFNVKISKEVKKTAEEEKVQLHTYQLIHELLKDINVWTKEKEESKKEKILGRASIIAQFPHNKTKIAGCKILEGKITKNDKLRLKREDDILGDIRAISLKKQKGEIDKAESGEEFGIYFEPQLDFKIGDVIESYLE